MHENASSIGFRSGEYAGRYNNRAPGAGWSDVDCEICRVEYTPHSFSISAFTSGSWWMEQLSRTTILCFPGKGFSCGAYYQA